MILFIRNNFLIIIMFIWLFSESITNAQNISNNLSHNSIFITFNPHDNVLKIPNHEIENMQKMSNVNIQIVIENQGESDFLILNKSEIVNNTTVYVNTVNEKYDLPFIFSGKGKLLKEHDTLSVVLLVSKKQVFLKAFNGTIEYTSAKIDNIQNMYLLIPNKKKILNFRENYHCNIITDNDSDCYDCSKKNNNINNYYQSDSKATIRKLNLDNDAITVRLALELNPSFVTGENNDTSETAIQKAIDDALSVTAAVNDIFYNEAKIKFNITSIRVWKDYTNHPWSYNPTYHLLNAFRWFYTYLDYKPSIDDRDITYIFDSSYQGEDGKAAGEAFVVMPCYSASTFSWGDGVRTMAHELGHNFGLPHTHECLWTINNNQISSLDSCYTKDNCAGSYEIQRTGQIMSYCRDNSLIFGEDCKKLLRSNTESCFEDSITHRIKISGSFDLSDFDLSNKKLTGFYESFISQITDGNKFSFNIPVKWFYFQPRVFGYYFPENYNFIGTKDFDNIHFTKVEVPKPPFLDTPFSGSETSIQPEFSWYDEYDATHYNFQIALDSSFQDIVYQDDYIKHDTTGFYNFYNSNYPYTNYSLTSQLPYLAKYYWRVKSVNYIGESNWSEKYSFVVGITSVENDNGTDKKEKLTISNFPNPFNEQTVLSYYLPQVTTIKIILYDILGRKYNMYSSSAQLKSGLNNHVLNLKSFSTGIYIYELLTEYGSVYGKLNFIK